MFVSGAITETETATKTETSTETQTETEASLSADSATDTATEDSTATEGSNKAGNAGATNISGFGVAASSRRCWRCCRSPCSMATSPVEITVAN